MSVIWCKTSVKILSYYYILQSKLRNKQIPSLSFPFPILSLMGAIE